MPEVVERWHVRAIAAWSAKVPQGVPLRPWQRATARSAIDRAMGEWGKPSQQDSPALRRGPRAVQYLPTRSGVRKSDAAIVSAPK
jgi:hypothetical protein